jgi:serine/threonine-protein kinase
VEVQELKPGDTLGRYQLLMPIAKGGMGQVWAARLSGTRGFQKLVAVKTILAVDEDAGNLEEMLFEEASLASQVRHPNVAQTLDLGEQNGTLYLVMEWVDGEPLDAILRASRAVGGIPIAIAVHLIIQALKGLQAAHEAKSAKGDPLGIVHRDISPQNLLVTYSGVVKLVDFGVAKATHQTTQPTTLGQVKGKFAYMSPEQVNGQPIDARADVFAMGIVLYRITTGKHPFKSDTPAATIHNILNVEPAYPSALAPSYPRALEEVVMKALARNRDERYASALEMMVALEQALPATVTANTEKNTESFLRRLFDKRIAERHEALQAAIKAAQGDGASIGRIAQFIPSQSTMRAVSVESADASAGASRMQALAVSVAPPKRKWPRSVVALTLGLALSIGFMAVRERREALVAHVAAFHPAPAVAAAPVPSITDPQSPPAEGPSAPTASAEARVTGDANAAAHAVPAVSSPAKRPIRPAPIRRDMAPPAPEAAAPVVPAPRPVAPADPAPAEVDPLNRRR